MRQRSSGLWMMAALGLAILPVQPAAATPVSCTGSTCSVSSGGAALSVDQFGEVTLLAVNNSDQLYTEVLYVTPGVNSPANPVTPTFIDSLYPIVSATADDDTDQIVIVFADATLSFTVTYTLSSAAVTATVDYSIVVQNLTGTAVDLAVVDYIDWDLRHDFHDDTIRFLAPSDMQTAGKNANADARALSGFDFEDVGFCCEESLFGRLVDGHLGGGVGPVGPADVSGAFQNNIALAPSGAFTITRQLQATVPALAAAPAPALSAGGLLAGLAGLGVVGAAALRRRRSAA